MAISHCTNDRSEAPCPFSRPEVARDLLASLHIPESKIMTGLPCQLAEMDRIKKNLHMRKAPRSGPSTWWLNAGLLPSAVRSPPPVPLNIKLLACSPQFVKINAHRAGNNTQVPYTLSLSRFSHPRILLPSLPGQDWPPLLMDTAGTHHLDRPYVFFVCCLPVHPVPTSICPWATDAAGHCCKVHAE